MDDSIKSELNSQKRIVILMACHNRATITQKFFKSFIAADKEKMDLEFIVCDDGSTDETAKILKSQPFLLKVVNGTGNLYWAKSMALAESSINKFHDGILWINDDLELSKDAFQILFRGIEKHPTSVLVGQVSDVASGEIIYGGYKRLGRHPLKLQLVKDSGTYRSVDTFNGNFVYIPTPIRLTVGPIDSFYQHAYADIDYGYRVRKAGYSINTLPKSVGTGFTNKITWQKGLRNKLRQQTSTKFNPTSSQIHFFRKHTGRFWYLFLPLYLITPIIRVFLFSSSTPSTNPRNKKVVI